MEVGAEVLSLRNATGKKPGRCCAIHDLGVLAEESDVLLVSGGRAGWGGTSLIWVVSAVFFCAVGSMSSLRVLYHAALVVAVLDLSKLGFRVSFLAAVCALSWLPSSGWLISRFHAGGLLGWERPVVAGLGWMFLILVKRRISFSLP